MDRAAWGPLARPQPLVLGLDRGHGLEQRRIQVVDPVGHATAQAQRGTTDAGLKRASLHLGAQALEHADQLIDVAGFGAVAMAIGHRQGAVDQGQKLVERRGHGDGWGEVRVGCTGTEAG